MARRRYVVDTSLFIDALRNEHARDDLAAFHAAFAPFEYMSAVVAQELHAGARGAAVAESPGDDLGPPVVAIQPRLGHHDSIATMHARNTTQVPNAPQNDDR